MFMHKYILIMFLLSVLQACGSAAVQPWEKGELAKREMLIVPDPLFYYFDEHTYFSREASIGGLGAGSGGCGCN